MWYHCHTVDTGLAVSLFPCHTSGPINELFTCVAGVSVNHQIDTSLLQLFKTIDLYSET